PGRLATELARWVAAARDMGAAGLAALDLLAAAPETPDAPPSPAAVEKALARAEEHQANVLRRVIPPFVRQVLDRAAT
ncbi:hypothetical protein AB0J43_57695, partial [Nonomuraea fuscirosea]